MGNVNTYKPPLEGETYEDIESRILDALRWLYAHPSHKVSDVARQFNIPYSRFNRRVKGKGKSYKEARASQKWLSEEQEETLLQWITYLGMMGFPLNKKALHAKIESACGHACSKSWVRRFKKRNRGHLVFNRASGLDSKRAQAFNYHNVDEHFTRLKDALSRYGVKWRNVYNMDEKGCQLGGGRKSNGIKYFFGRGDRGKYKQRSANLELVTVVECVCADGSSVPPGFIFSSGSQYTEWYNQEPNLAYGVATTENGWTDDFICADWFEKIFIPHAKAHREQPDEPILLILDGHGSHSTDRMREIATQHGIHLFALVPHTTHKLQPLDVGVFGPLQREYTKECDEVAATTGLGVEKRAFVKVYLKARRRAFKEDTIVKAFEKSGVFALSAGFFSAADYAPSQATSINPEVPNGFPEEYPPDLFSEFPSSDPAYDPDAPMENNDSESGRSSGGRSSKSSSSSTSRRSSTRDSSTTSSSSDSEDSDPEERTRLVMPSASTLQGDDRSTPDTIHAPIPSTSGYRTRSASRQVSQSPSVISRSQTPSQVGPQRHARRSSSTFSQYNPYAYVSDSRAPVRQQRDEILAAYLELKEEHAALRVEHASVVTHAVMMHGVFKEAQHRLYAQDEQRKGAKKKFKTRTTGLLTSEEALALWEADKKERKERAEAAQQRKIRHQERAAARQAQVDQLGPDTPLSGSLTAKNKAQLIYIASAIQVPTNKEELKKLTKVDIIAAINARLESQPTLRQQPRFAGLFTSRARGNRQAPADPVDPPAIGMDLPDGLIPLQPYQTQPAPQLQLHQPYPPPGSTFIHNPQQLEAGPSNPHTYPNWYAGQPYGPVYHHYQFQPE